PCRRTRLFRPCPASSRRRGATEGWRAFLSEKSSTHSGWRRWIIDTRQVQIRATRRKQVKITYCHAAWSCTSLGRAAHFSLIVPIFPLFFSINSQPQVYPYWHGFNAAFRPLFPQRLGHRGIFCRDYFHRATGQKN